MRDEVSLFWLAEIGVELGCESVGIARIAIEVPCHYDVV